ncbi:DUF6817 domain-containing protein [Paraglaciecola sp.]|uniref:DUF6817 domain-containing protein n=1 Tax=Paraglaciecola sp. TaxID=1920173 RepID=UPI0030F49ECD
MLDKIRRLIELSAGEFEHIDMQLIAHLDGTRCMLKAWGARDALQQAGLFHQAYSKGIVRDNKFFSQPQRQLIAEVIGTESEVIVYHYCACDREIFFNSLFLTNKVNYVDRFLQSALQLEPQLLKDLCEMFVATELELALNGPHKKLLQDQNFRTFMLKLAPYLSRGANNKTSQLLV